MTKPVEFSSFYKLLKAVRDGDKKKGEELEWMLAEYEHANEATSAYDELGQIFCHHGVMELFEYTGVDNIPYIKSLNNEVWEYLKVRMLMDLKEYMIKSMLNHAQQHQLAKKISSKWNSDLEEIEENMGGLAKYVTEGIIELVM